MRRHEKKLKSESRKIEKIMEIHSKLCDKCQKDQKCDSMDGFKKRLDKVK
jgi:predicted nucleotide-binding protein (sugar kinase/HSP70/actin superfamily)